jgi:hypothetical protein
METTIISYLNGDSSSRHQLDEFLISTDYWNIILIELENCSQWQSDAVKFLLIYISRRLLLNPSEEIPVSLSALIDLLLQIRHLVYVQSLNESLSTLLALISLNQLQERLLIQSVEYIQGNISQDSPLLLIKYYTELASRSNENTKLFLVNINPLILNYTVEIFRSEMNLDQLKAAAVMCIRIWMSCHLISSFELLNSNQSNLIQILGSHTVPSNEYPLTLLAIADFYDEVLSAISEVSNGPSIPSGKTISIQTGDHSSITNGFSDATHSLDTPPSLELSPLVHESLVHSLSRHSAAFQSAITEGYRSYMENSERVSWQHSYIRILAASLKFMFHLTANPFLSKENLQSGICSDLDILNVLQQTSLACSHVNISYAVIAMEVPPSLISPLLSHLWIGNQFRSTSHVSRLQKDSH